MQISKILTIITLIGILTISCNKNDETPAPTPITVSFEDKLNGSVSIIENALPAETYNLILSGPAPADGTILCTFPETGFPDRFNTIPGANRFDGGVVFTEIFLKQGQTSAEFRIGPYDNMVADGDLTVSINLVSVDTHPVAVPGTNSELQVTIVDDEVPMPVGFSPTTITELKKSDGSVTFGVDALDWVRLNGSVQVDISSSNAVYGTHYTINPKASNGKFQLEYPRGLYAQVFILEIMQDASFTEPLIINFKLEDHAGGITPSKDASLSNEITISISPN